MLVVKPHTGRPLASACMLRVTRARLAGTAIDFAEHTAAMPFYTNDEFDFPVVQVGHTHP
jgi:hypothetical protein